MPGVNAASGVICPGRHKINRAGGGAPTGDRNRLQERHPRRDYLLARQVIFNGQHGALLSCRCLAAGKAFDRTPGFLVTCQ